MLDSSKPWKWDVDILRSPQYEGVGSRLLYCDDEDRLWMPLSICFDASRSTDARPGVMTSEVVMSADGGVTWKLTDRPSPAPSSSRVDLSEETIIELVEMSDWTRYPRTEIERLEAEGYYVWDLGEEHDYCAIIYEAMIRVSKDGGRTWRERSIRDQLPFFAHFVVRPPLQLLDDGALIFFAYGYGKNERLLCRKEGKRSSYNSGRSSGYALRSGDNGENWDLVLMADGRHSCLPTGFTETFPVVQGDGNLFVMLRTALGNFAYSVWSSDGGKTWSEPVQTPIRAKHPRPTVLRDGTILCTYQRRFAQPYGVRARFTSNMGETWSEEVVIRDDICITDGLGGIRTVELLDGSLFTVFNAMKYDDEGRPWPFLAGSRWTRSYRGPYGPKLEAPPAGERYNYPR